MKTKTALYLTNGLMVLALTSAPQNVEAAGSPISITHDFEVEWGYVADANVKGEGREFDSGEEYSAHARYLLSPQITSRVLLHFGAEWQRFSFSMTRHAPVPDTLQGVNAIIGADWQFSDRWLFRAEVRPGVYSTFRDVSWDHVNAPVFLGGVYLASTDVQWFLGLRLDPWSDYPVIPGVGLRWKFDDDWTLNAILPNPRLEYEIDPRFSVYLGAEMKAGSFRVGDRFGSDRSWPELDGQILDYFEVSVGPGFKWKIRPDVEVEANAGYMVYRRFEFADRDAVFRSDPAPRFQAACNLSF